MIYVSYFNKLRTKELVDKIYRAYSIALYQFTDYPVAKELLVDKGDFMLYKKGCMSLKELKSRYRKKLESFSSEDLERIASKYDGCILLCHEKTGCHREELCDFLNARGYACKELEVKDFV